MRGLNASISMMGNDSLDTSNSDGDQPVSSMLVGAYINSNNTEGGDNGSNQTLSAEVFAMHYSSVTTNQTSVVTDRPPVATDSTSVATDSTGVAIDSTSVATESTSVATDSTGVAIDSVARIATDSTSLATDSTNVATDSSSIELSGVDVDSFTTGPVAFQSHESSLPDGSLLTTSALATAEVLRENGQVQYFSAAADEYSGDVTTGVSADAAGRDATTLPPGFEDMESQSGSEPGSAVFDSPTMSLATNTNVMEEGSPPTTAAETTAFSDSDVVDDPSSEVSDGDVTEDGSGSGEVRESGSGEVIMAPIATPLYTIFVRVTESPGPSSTASQSSSSVIGSKLPTKKVETTDFMVTEVDKSEEEDNLLKPGNCQSAMVNKYI